MLSPDRHIVFFVFIIGCLLFLNSCSEDKSALYTEVEIAPDFTLELFDGGTFQLSDMKGKVVVINFFASWCVSCGEETPTIERVSQDYAKKGVVFLAIAVDDTERKAKEFIKKYGLTIPAGLDRAGEIKEAYGLYGMPTTFFIDKEGMVSYFHAGVVTEKLLEHEIEKLL
ncbi:MAG: TlpA family protein disulfide reductase [Gammaproteobacteria bacterium]|nr:TlpA family protein disulfide reductase [Gammaproteobacteria bacterium]